ncbi:hypothetical protein BC827DRAFT_1155347 [Russula dissimulans]|nr:hypothetical protein BC827DRAFT_1155347 [Russula dissimulans]
MPSFEFHGSALLYRVIGIIFQTLFYGQPRYIILPPSTDDDPPTQHHSRAQGFKGTQSSITGVALHHDDDHVCAVDRVLDLVRHRNVLVIDAWFSSLDPATHYAPNWLPMFNAIILINYTLADVVVVWRAWVLCADHNKAFLMVPVVCLVINAFVYVVTVAVRAGLFITPEYTQIHRNLAHIIDVTQVADLSLSLLTNVLATSIMAVEAWKYRKSLMRGDGGTSTPATQILVLFVESGLLYIIIGATVLASLFIHLPFGTLGDILIPIGVQLAGMYPIVVLLLVDQRWSLRAPPTFRPAPPFWTSGPVKLVKGSTSSQIVVEKVTQRNGEHFTLLSATNSDDVMKLLPVEQFDP